MEDADGSIVHGTTVGLDRTRGLLIIGRSGTGKSGLALALMARGALLVADDRTTLTPRGDWLVAGCPSAIRGRIEARGIGLLAADVLPETRLTAVLDLDREERERLPPLRETRLQGVTLPLLYRASSAYFADGLMQFLRKGRVI